MTAVSNNSNPELGNQEISFLLGCIDLKESDKEVLFNDSMQERIKSFCYKHIDEIAARCKAAQFEKLKNQCKKLGNQSEEAAQNAGEAAQNAGEAAQNAGEAAQNAGEAAQNAGEAAQNAGEAAQ
ncbi:MAG: hypothetical protein AAF443_04855, partial [Chlamydiota bacterium]